MVFTLADPCHGGYWDGDGTINSLRDCTFWAYDLGWAPLDSPHKLAAGFYVVRIKRKSIWYSSSLENSRKNPFLQRPLLTKLNIVLVVKENWKGSSPLWADNEEWFWTEIRYIDNLHRWGHILKDVKIIELDLNLKACCGVSNRIQKFTVSYSYNLLWLNMILT